MTVTAPCGAWTSPVDARPAAAHNGSPDFAGTVGDEVWYRRPGPAELSLYGQVFGFTPPGVPLLELTT
jgi:hypothetical protein